MGPSSGPDGIPPSVISGIGTPLVSSPCTIFFKFTGFELLSHGMGDVENCGNWETEQVRLHQPGKFSPYQYREFFGKGA